MSLQHGSSRSTSGLMTLTAQGGGGSQRRSPVKLSLLWICGRFEDSCEQFVLALLSLNSSARSALAVAGFSCWRVICCSFCRLIPVRAWLCTIQSVTALAGWQNFTHEHGLWQNTSCEQFISQFSLSTVSRFKKITHLQHEIFPSAKF